MEKHKNSHLEAELVKLRKSAVEIVSSSYCTVYITSVFYTICAASFLGARGMVVGRAAHFFFVTLEKSVRFQVFQVQDCASPSTCVGRVVDG